MSHRTLNSNHLPPPPPPPPLPTATMQSSSSTPSPPLSTTTTSDDKPKTEPKLSHTHLSDSLWSEKETRTLISAWGSHYLHQNHGILRPSHWQSVADTVNSTHLLRRTPVQCKNRVDTIKKKFKIEKSKSHSDWPHFRTLDSLIGTSYPKTLRRELSPSPSPSASPSPSPSRSPSPPPRAALLKWSVPVAPRSKRCRLRERGLEEEKGEGVYGPLAEAIVSLGKIYERVEVEKQRQMVELEKQRMHFFKDVEIHRMRVFMESQVLVRNLKRPRRSLRVDNSNSYM